MVVFAACAGCKEPSVLLEQYLDHRTAIENHDWQWIAEHLSRQFLATHASQILGAESVERATTLQKIFWNQATLMRRDEITCSASESFTNYGKKGVLEAVMKRSNGRVQQISYTFVIEDDGWRLDGIYILDPSAFGGNDLPCDKPLKLLAPISEHSAPLV